MLGIFLSHPVRAIRNRRAFLERDSRRRRRRSVATMVARTSLGAELERLLDAVEDDEIAVSITARAEMDPADYAGAVERRWAAEAG